MTECPVGILEYLLHMPPITNLLMLTVYLTHMLPMLGTQSLCLCLYSFCVKSAYALSSWDTHFLCIYSVSVKSADTCKLAQFRQTDYIYSHCVFVNSADTLPIWGTHCLYLQCVNSADTLPS